MPQPDEREHRRPRETAPADDPTAATTTPDGLPPSKTRRKAEMRRELLAFYPTSSWAAEAKK